MTDVLILGTGAMATLFAWRLRQAHHAVTLLGTWPAALQTLSESGARLVDERGVEGAVTVRVTADPAECQGARLAIVLVKAWQTERAARQLQECLAADGLALTLQNGLGNRETLAEKLGEPRVALGSTTTGATLLGPGLVKPGGEGTLSLEAHPSIGPLAEALGQAGFRVEIVNDAQRVVWGKLVINAAINPLTALLRITNGELLERPAARRLMRALAQEAAAVARAECVELAFPDAAAAAEEVARRTGANHSSMLQDVLRHAPTEIDAICGEITRRGEQHGVPTPVNAACWQLLQAVREGA